MKKFGIKTIKIELQKQTVLIGLYDRAMFIGQLSTSWYRDMQEKVKARLRESRLLAAGSEFTQPSFHQFLQFCTESLTYFPKACHLFITKRKFMTST